MSVLTTTIATARTAKSRINDIDWNNLEFGKYISDHMLVVNYDNAQWSDMEIKPFGEMAFTPAMLALHYGQSVFEGMKAFKNTNGDICIFRPQKHSERLNKSLTRMCMPPIPEEMFLQSLHALIEFDQNWIPTSEGSSLYIRPVVFATESRFGVKISDQYAYVLMTSPVGPYFSNPVRIKIEESYVRAAEGGAGFAKCAGNYGGAFYPTQLAREQGFDQILWTDAKEHKYIDEAGVMNAMFIIDRVLVTPALSTSILDGVTRDTIINLAPSLGVTVEQRRISVEEVINGITSGKLTEAFGAGTAAVVSPIASVSFKDQEYHLPAVASDSFQLRVKEKLNNIRMGIEDDTFGWNYIIKSK